MEARGEKINVLSGARKEIAGLKKMMKMIGERERANLVVRTGDFSVIYIFISGAAYVV